MVALPRTQQAEDASEVEATIVGAALEEIAGTRHLGTHGHRQNHHWKNLKRQPLSAHGS
jgi:hypothetical protein